MARLDSQQLMWGMSDANFAKFVFKPHTFFTTKTQRKKRANTHLTIMVLIRNILQILQNQNPFCDDLAVAASVVPSHELKAKSAANAAQAAWSAHEMLKILQLLQL